MKFTDIFIRRPVLAIVVNVLIIIGGVQAYRSLNVRQYPRSENAAVTVTTVYVGANAELVRGFITTPLERTMAANFERGRRLFGLQVLEPLLAGMVDKPDGADITNS